MCSQLTEIWSAHLDRKKTFEAPLNQGNWLWFRQVSQGKCCLRESHSGLGSLTQGRWTWEYLQRWSVCWRGKLTSCISGIFRCLFCISLSCLNPLKAKVTSSCSAGYGNRVLQPLGPLVASLLFLCNHFCFLSPFLWQLLTMSPLLCSSV